MKPKEIKGFDGHIILYCKNHYTFPKGFINGLRMIWAIRCGYPYNENDHSADQYIANRLYKLLQELVPERMQYLQERIHDDITCDWRFASNTSFIERLISVYCSEIANIQVKEKRGEKFYSLIKLSKPMKKVFNRILRGNGKYEDYWLVEPKS